MIFKNIIAYQITEELDINQIIEQLNSKEFTSCPTHSEYSLGWASPAYTDELAYQNGSCYLLCLTKESKIMPAAAINKLVDEKVADIEKIEDRKILKKERNSIKDEIIFEKLPTALTKLTKTYGYIDTVSQQIIVGAVSHTKAEEFLSFLRKTTGSLPVIPITADSNIQATMTQWVKNKSIVDSNEFNFGDECVLVDHEEGRHIRCKNVDMESEDIMGHIGTGMLIKSLGIEHEDDFSFVLNDDLTLKKIKILEGQSFDDAATLEEEFNASFFLESTLIRDLLNDLFVLFSIKSQ